MGAFERIKPGPRGAAGGFRLEVEDGELLAKLRALEAELGVKILRSALRAGAAVIRKRARELAPVGKGPYVGSDRDTREPGDLKKSIGIRTRLNPDGDGWEAIIIVRAWWAHFLEFGVAPHSIKGKRFTSQGQLGRTRASHHPGFAAQPFLRPAYDEKRGEAIRRFRRTVERRIARLTKK